MEVGSGTCFEDLSELMEFYNSNKIILSEKFQQYINREKPNDALRLKSCAYNAVAETVAKSGNRATDCQANRLAEVLCFSYSP